MAERILITCTDSMMKQFLELHVRNLAGHGYEVEIACSEVLNRMAEVREDLGNLVRIHQVDLRRSPLALSNARGYRQLKELIDSSRYDLIWTNEPVMGVVTRLAARKARKTGTKVLYMVHGFHFYKGAPLANWLLFYPIERLLASRTDCICTINREDYVRAQNMPTPKAAYVHGIGLDTARLQPRAQPTDLRKKLGLHENAFLLLSVGELNENKNQQVILRAMEKLRDYQNLDRPIHYILCGKGDQQKFLEGTALKLQLKNRVHFLGYQKDVADVYRQCDVFTIPSRREGLPLAALEAMYCGLPILNSAIRGLTDFTEDGVSGFSCRPDDAEGFAEGIKKLYDSAYLRAKAGRRNQQTVVPFCVESTGSEILNLIRAIM